MRRAVEVAWITSLDEARTIESEWRTLVDRADGITPFQYPDWILPWYEVWAADRVRVLTARDAAGLLRGVVPVTIQEDRLELAGSGVGDYLAPVVADTTDTVAVALDDALARVGLRIRFNDVPPEAAWAIAARGMQRWDVQTSSACPVRQLPETSPAWRESLPSGLRRNVKRYSERLSDDAGGRFETIARDEGQLAAAMRALIALHTKRWHERGLPGVLNDDQVRRFHASAAPGLMRSGLLRLHLLYAGNDIIGAQYVLVRRSCAYSYLAGFDPSWDAYSPGTLLMEFAIEQAIEEGCTAFDFLRGREPYKYRWGAADRCSLSFSRNGVS